MNTYCKLIIRSELNREAITYDINYFYLFHKIILYNILIVYYRQT